MSTGFSLLFLHSSSLPTPWEAEQSPQCSNTSCYRSSLCCNRARIPRYLPPLFPTIKPAQAKLHHITLESLAAPWRNLCYTSNSCCSEFLWRRTISYFFSNNNSSSDVPTQVPFAQCSPTSSHSWKAEMQEDAEALLQLNSPVSEGGPHRCPGLATASASRA